MTQRSDAPPRWLIAASAAVAVAGASGAVAVAVPLLEAPTAAGPAAPSPAAPSPAAPTPEPTPAPTPAPTLAPTPAPTPAPPSPAPDCEATVAIRFPRGLALVPPDTDATLAPVIAFAAAHPSAEIVVDGHADPTGSDYKNLLLSKARAHGVAARLAAAGVRARVTERAFGAYVPTGSDADAEQRRVQVTVRDPQCGGSP